MKTLKKRLEEQGKLKEVESRVIKIDKSKLTKSSKTTNNSIKSMVDQVYNKKTNLPKNTINDLQKINTKQINSDITEKFEKNYKSDTWKRVLYKANQLMNNTAYIGKKTGAGLLSGATGLAQAYLTDTANQIQKGQDKKAGDLINNFNPTLSRAKAISETIKENIDTIKDKDKNLIDKLVDIGTNTVSDASNIVMPGKQQINALNQVIGRLSPQADEELLELNKTISEPSKKLNEQLEQEREQHGEVTQFLGDAFQSVGNMLPSIGATVVTKNPTIGLATMGISAKGQSTQEALDRGAELDEAIRIGDTKALIEIGTEKLTGGINIFGKSAMDDIVEKGLIGKVKNQVVSFLLKQGYNTAGEITEETISDIVGTLIDKGTVDPNATYSIKDWKDTAITTTLSSAILNLLTGGLVSDIKISKTTSDLYKNLDKQNDLTETEKQNLQKDIQEGNVNSIAEQNNKIEDIKLRDTIISSSNLNEESKKSLQRVAEKNNFTSEQTKELINSHEQRYNLPISDFSQATIQNKPISEQEQQTILNKGKTAKNQNTNEIDKDYENILNNAKYLTEQEKKDIINDFKDVEKSEESLEEFKYVVESLNKENKNLRKQEVQEILDTNKTYSTGRAEIYKKYIKSKNEYDRTAVDNAKELVKGSKKAKGRRTKSEWLNVAKQIGTEIANKSDAEIEEIAFRSWQDERPNYKESLNRQGQNYIKFTSDEWVNEIYNQVKAVRGNKTTKLTRTKSNLLKSDDIRTEVKQFLRKSGRDTSNEYIDTFIDRAMNFKLDESDISNPELRNIIEKIQDSKIEKEIITDEKNRKYVKADRQVIKGNNPREWQIQTENYINEEIRKGNDVKVITDTGDVLTITKDTAGKAKFRNEIIRADGRKTTLSNKELLTKLTAETHIDELGQISTKINKLPVADTKKHKFAKDGFDYRRAYFEDFDGQYYRVTMSVGKNGNIDTIYNIGRMDNMSKKNRSKSSVTAQRPLSQKTNEEDLTSNKSITKNKTDVNTLKSYSEEELIAQGDNSQENEIDRKINTSMTMSEAEQMIQRAFIANKIGEWYDNKYANGNEWLEAEGAEDVAMYIENTYELQSKYINSNEDILNEEYTIEDVINAYSNGTLRGQQKVKSKRLDLSKDTGYQATKFYEPREIQGGIEEYNIANQRVTNQNKEEVYRARANFIINAHNQNYINQLGITQEEVNKKLKSWANYPKKAMDLSNRINKNASTQNRWAGIENSSILNTISVNEEEMQKLVKEIKGNSTEYERQYITSVMLAIDTHTDFSLLTFDFSPDRVALGSALADYNPNIDLIRVGRSGQNTIAHEIGHYLDHLWGRQLWGNNLGITNRVSESNFDNHNLTENQKQFIRNFYKWFDSVEATADIRSSYTMTPTEVMARFIAKFTEWTKNVATNNRYGYENKWYNDNFTESQFVEFATLLQEKALLDTTENYANYNKQKYGSAKIEADKLDEFFDSSFNETETRNITDEIYREEINEGKTRKHYKSIFESDLIGETGKEVAKELYKKDTYTPISNLQTLTEANDFIGRTGIDGAYTSFTNKLMSNERITLQDIAIGERLIQIYSENGDMQKVDNLIQDVAILGTELGQMVQAFNLIKRASPEGQLQYLQKVLNRTNIKEDTNIQITPEMEEQILQSRNSQELEENVADIAEAVAQEIVLKTGDKIRAWRYLSMLGNPKTHIKNLGANAFMNLTQNVKNKVAGGMEDVVSVFNKDMERTKTLRRANKEQREFAKQDAEAMQDNIDGGGKYDIKNIIQNSKRQFDNKVLNAIAEFNSNLLEGEDKIFLKLAYQQAMQGYMSANKLKTSDMTGQTLEKARQYASLQAQEATFHEFNAVAQALSQLENKGGLVGGATSAILPFKKTPMNIAKAGFQYSPAGLATTMTVGIGKTISDTKKLQTKLKDGKITQEQYKTETSKMLNKNIDNMAKGITGTGLALLGYFLAKQGILKAGNDDEADEFEEKLGKQAYAIQIGDYTYSLDWISPSAIPLFIGATVQQLGESENEEDKQSVINSALTATAKSFEPMTEMSMLQGLTSAITSYEQGSSNMLFDLGASMVTSYAGQFVPTALGQVAKTIDPYERDTSSTKKGIEGKVDRFVRQQMNKLPVASTKLPVKKDVWGNEVKRSDNLIVRALDNAILPFNMEKVIEDSTDKELLKVFEKSGENVLPRSTKQRHNNRRRKIQIINKRI